MRKLQNILVTGGAGFIGTNFIRCLFGMSASGKECFNFAEFNGRVVNLDALTYAGNLENLSDVEEKFGTGAGKNQRYFFEKGDICDRKNVERIFKEYEIDTVVHFAAESHVDRSVLEPEAFIKTNVLGTYTLLDVAKNYWGCSLDNVRDDVLFHHISTDEVYGSLGPEGYFTETTLYDPRSPYSSSKASSDHIAMAYYHTFALPVTLSNCTNNYGPYQFPEKLIPLMILNISQKKPLPVYGKGENVRDWIYVEDHNRAVWQILQSGKVGQKYNIGGENEWQNIKLLDKIIEIAARNLGMNADDVRKTITHVKDRPGHDLRYAIDCAKIKTELGWQREMTFEQGLELTVEWNLSHKEWIEHIQSGAYMKWVEKIMRSARFFFVIFFCFASLFAQQYKIATVNYSAEGLTKESALKRNANIQEGKVFDDTDALESYIEEARQKLLNTRLFESVQVEYTLTEPETEADEDAPIPVTISVATVDSKHFLLLPYPKYNSNEGVEIKAKLKDANFLGTMSEMTSDLFFLFEQKQNQPKDYVLGADIKYDLPFNIGKVQAFWNNDFSFEYAFKRKEPEWNLKTGFTFLLPFERFDLRLDLTQGSTRELDYKKFGDETYFTEEANFSVPIRLAKVPNYGNLVYTPAVGVVYNWDKDGINILNEDLVSPILTISNGLSIGQINWVGNFRKGLFASVEQIMAYNFQLKKWQPGATATLKYFHAWKYAGINSRLTIFGQLNSYRRYGHCLRGVGDDQYFANSTGLGDVYACKSSAAIILNLDFPIRLFATNWENTSCHKLKNFNFEVQIAPFIDIALTQNRATGRVFHPRDGFYTCGIEILVFPEKWKSVQLRASAGFDLSRLLFKKAVDTSWRDTAASTKEFSIGIGMFY